MAKILVFYNDTEILGWLYNEDITDAEKHIVLGYQNLADGYVAGTVKAANIEVDDADKFNMSAYCVSDGAIIKSN